MTQKSELVNIGRGINPSGRGRSLGRVLLLLLPFTLLVERMSHILKVCARCLPATDILFVSVRIVILHILELLEVLSDLISTTALHVRSVISLTSNLPNLLWLKLMMHLAELIASSLSSDSLATSRSRSVA